MVDIALWVFAKNMCFAEMIMRILFFVTRVSFCQSGNNSLGGFLRRLAVLKVDFFPNDWFICEFFQDSNIICG